VRVRATSMSITLESIDSHGLQLSSFPFPTRRSSDLCCCRTCWPGSCAVCRPVIVVALPAAGPGPSFSVSSWRRWWRRRCCRPSRSEEHTSELQSREKLVCRLLLQKKHNTEERVFLIRRENVNAHELVGSSAAYHDDRLRHAQPEFIGTAQFVSPTGQAQPRTSSNF